MIGIGWSEMLIIAIVLIVVVGPKDLPKMLRTFGRTTANLRRMAGDFQKQFDEALKEAELDEVRNLAKEARKFNPASELKKAINPLEKAAQDVRSGLDDAIKPGRSGNRQAQPDESRKPASASARAATPVKGGAAEKAAPDSASATKAAATQAKADNSTEPASAKPRAAKPVKTAATAKTSPGNSGKPAGNAGAAKPRSAPKKTVAAKTGSTASAGKAMAKTSASAGKAAGKSAGSKTKGAQTS